MEMSFVLTNIYCVYRIKEVGEITLPDIVYSNYNFQLLEEFELMEGLHSKLHELNPVNKHS